jgi:crotonobetainyl-CoA:carnitine CoA-transferase CaiB-like acyl-CoA transferase
MTQQSLPLNGVLVLDLAHWLAGPLVSRILADLGADVIKIEPPGGETVREFQPGTEWVPRPTFLALNRDKRSVELDVKSEAGAQALRDLVARADVLVHNFRPGVAERLGISAQDMLKLNPSLVYCSVSGYGSQGPYSRFPATDGAIQAFSGMLDQFAAPGEDYGEPAGFIVADVLGGMCAAIAVLGALCGRAHTGKGAHVDPSMAEAGLYARMLACEGGMPPPQTFTAECQDGHHILVQTSPYLLSRFIEVIGTIPGFDDFDIAAAFAAASADSNRLDAYLTGVRAIFATKPRDEWIALLAQAGVPAAPRNSYLEALEHEQVRARGAATSTDVPGLGEVPLAASPFLINGHRRTDTAAPRPLGADTAAVLRDLLGYGEDAVAAVCASLVATNALTR